MESGRPDSSQTGLTAFLKPAWQALEVKGKEDRRNWAARWREESTREGFCSFHASRESPFTFPRLLAPTTQDSFPIYLVTIALCIRMNGHKMMIVVVVIK